MTADTPLGQIVDLGLRVREPAGLAADAPAVVLNPAPVANWRVSSHDLLNGLEVTDQTDSIPGELFDKLFRR